MKERDITVNLHDGTFINFNTVDRVIFQGVRGEILISLTPDDIADDLIITLADRVAEIDRLRKELGEIYDLASLAQDETESPSIRYNAANMIKYKVNQVLEAKGEDERE